MITSIMAFLAGILVRFDRPCLSWILWWCVPSWRCVPGGVFLAMCSFLVMWCRCVPSWWCDVFLVMWTAGKYCQEPCVWWCACRWQGSGLEIKFTFFFSSFEPALLSCKIGLKWRKRKNVTFLTRHYFNHGKWTRSGFSDELAYSQDVQMARS